MRTFIKRIKLPDGTVYSLGDRLPTLTSSEDSYTIGTITVAPKVSDDVGADDATLIEETRSSIELWAQPPPGLQDENGVPITFCHRIYDNGLAVDEVWFLMEAIKVVRIRLGEVDDEGDEPLPRPRATTQAAAPAQG